MNAVDFGSMPLADKLTITWSFYWRAMLIGIAAMLFTGVVCGAVGFVIGFVLGAVGFPRVFVQLFGMLLGFGIGSVIGFLCFLVYLHWILSSQLGHFRLLLVRADRAPPFLRR